MPTPCYMYIEDAEGNVLTAGASTAESIGEGYVSGHEDEFMVQGIAHEVTIPRDPQSGQPTGRRVHMPLTVTKIVDKASPILLEALTSGKRLGVVKLNFYRTSSIGDQEHYYTLELHDAILVNIRLDMPNAIDPSKKEFGHMEYVSFTYREILWTHEIAGTSGADDWRGANK